jgi:hypothetical protein
MMTKCFMLSWRSSVAMLGSHRLPVSKILQKRHYESHRSCKPGYLNATAYPGSLYAYHLLRMTVEPPYCDSDTLPHTEPRLASEEVVSTAYSWITCGIAMPGRCRLSWSAPQFSGESEHTSENHQRADVHSILRGVIPSARSDVFSGSSFPKYEADTDIINVTYFYS